PRGSGWCATARSSSKNLYPGFRPRTTVPFFRAAKEKSLPWFRLGGADRDDDPGEYVGVRTGDAAWEALKSSTRQLALTDCGKHGSSWQSIPAKPIRPLKSYARTTNARLESGCMAR